MSVQIYTSRISSRDPDRFDITRKSGGEGGAVFAPSWAILSPALKAMECARKIRSVADGSAYPGILAPPDPDAARVYNARADDLEARTWAVYVPAYMAEMRRSYHVNRAAWNALLARSRVVLVCYCVDATRCHRMLLAERCLRPMGADVHGEIGVVEWPEQDVQQGLFS